MKEFLVIVPIISSSRGCVMHVPPMLICELLLKRTLQLHTQW